MAGAIVCCALWGGNAIAVKYSVPDLPPLGCAGLRFLIGLPIVALVCVAAGQRLSVARGNWPLLALHALMLVLQIGTFNLGTGMSLAGRASVLINIHPLVVAPLSWWLLGERLGPKGLVGLLAAAGGVSVLLAPALLHGSGQPGNLTGDLIVAFSGLLFGVQTIVQKLTFPRIAPASLLFQQSLIAVPLLGVLSWFLEGLQRFHFTSAATAGLLYQGIAASGLCYSLWFLLLKRYEASRLVTVAFLTPIFGLGLSRWLRGEPLTWPLVAGAGLVGLGIYLTAVDRGGRRVSGV